MPKMKSHSGTRKRVQGHRLGQDHALQQAGKRHNARDEARSTHDSAG